MAILKNTHLLLFQPFQSLFLMKQKSKWFITLKKADRLNLCKQMLKKVKKTEFNTRDNPFINF